MRTFALSFTVDLLCCFLYFRFSFAGISPTSFYSSNKRQRRSRYLIHAADDLFNALNGGNDSDIDGEPEEANAESVVAPQDGDEDSGESTEEYENDSDPGEVSSVSAKWTRRKFRPPASQFNAVSNENESAQSDMPSPYDYFSRYIPKSIFLELADKTNQYSVFKEGASVDTNEEEIRRLVSLHIVMGIFKFPRLRLYWRPSLRTDLFSSMQMSRNRFEKLRNNLHIVDVNNDQDPDDRLWKVRPLLDSFRRGCQRVDLEECLCIDEQIIPFRGQLNIKQYIKGKPNPWGVKVFMLCGASGIVHDFLVYQGSTTALSPQHKEKYGVTGALVLHLAESIPVDVGHKLFFDNYFTSLPVLRLLLEKRIFAAATIRPNRTERCPLKTEAELKKVGRGATDCMVSRDGTVVVTRWLDNRAVNLASNYLSCEPEDTARRWSKAEKRYIDVKRPAVVREYNKSMGGVDKMDFLVALYRTFIRSRKWTLRVMFHFVNMAVANAWLEYRRDARARKLKEKDQMDLLDFTLSVAEALAKAGVVAKPQKRGRPSASPLQPAQKIRCYAARPVEDVRYDQMAHWPSHDGNREQRCMLEGCKQKTRTMCDKCQVHLCLCKARNCFKAFHIRA